ncbi:MAG: hypothetical protein DRJ42_13985 [Deltaproteobacteria bacterium]|nr:MAG: hypothetical protein DRJ42_13985 [Deltaproteobacteria bacterium]
MPLEACRSCSRHIRIAESVCPFCAAPVLTGFAERSRRRVLPVGRIGRAAFLAWGTTVGALACADGGGDNSSAPSSVAVPDESEAAATLTPVESAADELNEQAEGQAQQAQQARARATAAEEAAAQAEARAEESEEAAEAAAEASPMRRRRGPRMPPEGGNVPLYGSPSF